MKSSLSYFDVPSGAATTSLRQRCLRAMTIVASSWGLLGSAILFFTLDRQTHLAERLHVVALICEMIGLAIFSIVLPLHYLLRESGDPR
jgi:hypothetical protein